MNKNQSGNAMMIVLAALVLLAVGGLVYLSMHMTGAEKAPESAETAAVEEKSPQPADMTIEPGNPVVAKVGGEEIKRQDVVNFIQALPPESRQIPMEKLFPMALDQVVNARVIEKKTAGLNLDSDPVVKKQLEQARAQITRGVYIQNAVQKKMTDDRLKGAYNQYVANFPKVEEVHARHILVKDESAAKDVIKQLESGAKFEDLAKEKSIDATASNGGDLGYFLKTDVVPAFGDAAFTLAPGSYTKEPVKSEFGYHVIMVEDKRPRAPLAFEKAKPFLAAQLQQAVLEELVQEWRDAAKVEEFDINGKPVTAPPADSSPAPDDKKS